MNPKSIQIQTYPNISKHIQITKTYPLSRGCLPGRAHPPIGLCSSYSFRWLFGSLQNRGTKGAGSEWVFLLWQIFHGFERNKKVLGVFFFASKIFFLSKLGLESIIHFEDHLLVFLEVSSIEKKQFFLRLFSRTLFSNTANTSLELSSPTLPYCYMDKILHHQGWWLSHYLQGFVHPTHPRWCRISAINSYCLFFVVQSPTSSEGQAQGDLHGLWGGKGQGLCPGDWEQLRLTEKNLPMLVRSSSPPKMGKHYLKPHGKKPWSTSSWWFQHIFLTFFLWSLGSWSNLTKSFSNGLKPPTTLRITPLKTYEYHLKIDGWFRWFLSFWNGPFFRGYV